ncbi:plasmid segregation protein ParM [Salirhabdus euzebyi]|uniref:Plasmid segregation protein ParM n=1 Tax=Salirhabdus euzebyi TaxID=394506 RepID=A0A841Q1W6_9BACI|nr:ParM/StbA family protein [Salirhabdus euzebyi]MBB6451965.1 plasmid segregation protein ParM [Salirhabdus euzebyi]
MLLAVDAGNYKVKVVGKEGVLDFYSDIGEYREIKLKQKHGEEDMVVEYEGKKYFAGTLAKFESEFGGLLMGKTKAHNDAKIRTLIALHRYCLDGSQVKLITGQPIEMHDDEEKMKIVGMLQGTHQLTINNSSKTIHVDDVKVAPEGAIIAWHRPRKGRRRVIDIGSGTINCATIHDMRYIDKDSFTISFGANTNISNDYERMAEGIIRQTSKKWDKFDEVEVAGGIAKEMLPYLKQHFINAEVIEPQFRTSNTIHLLHPSFVNAYAMYKFGVKMYGEKN